MKYKQEIVLMIAIERPAGVVLVNKVFGAYSEVWDFAASFCHLDMLVSQICVFYVCCQSTSVRDKRRVPRHSSQLYVGSVDLC